MIAAAGGPTGYWYLTRGTGTVALILLTLSVALGIGYVRRLRPGGVPRFVLDAAHRNISMLAVAFTAVHIITSLLDTFAPIRLVDVVLPFVGIYRPIWLGLGTVAFDLLIAVTVTSVWRRHIGHTTWRVVHWTSYACWPVALLHTYGTGSDAKVWWMLVLSGICVAIVVAAVITRATDGWPSHATVRAGAIGAAALVPIGLVAWLPGGPLANGWARRAGTPSDLLVSAPAARSSTAGGSSQSSGGGGVAASASARPSFTAEVNGTVDERQDAGGSAVVDIDLSVTGQALSTLRVTISGIAAAGGGVQMTSSRVTFGSASDPAAYRGNITALEGTNLEAHLRNAGGAAITVVAQLQLDPGGGAAAGTVTVNPSS